MRKLQFTPQALEVFNLIKNTDPTGAESIKVSLRLSLNTPTEGTGDPHHLQEEYTGLWERATSCGLKIVYSFDDENLIVNSIRLKDDAIPLNIESFSEEEYKSVMAQMEANRGKDSEPHVGIFWYNRGKNELFGVVSHRISDYTRANASDGRITCSEMHEDVWKKEYYKQRYHGGVGPFIGAYQDKPRGRIFYNIETDTYDVAVGKWIEEYPHVYGMILKEFHLPPEKTKAKYAIHWDIGMSWR